MPVAAFCLTFALVAFLPQVLNDSDTLWQIATGGWILDHHAVPSTDPFSFTAGDRHWFAHEWLAETALALAWRAGRMQGVVMLAAACTGLATALLLRCLMRFLPMAYALVGTVLALSNAAPSLLARPHLLAWPCLVLWVGGLVTARARRDAPSWALLPVMLLWVNLHGSFMVGLLLPFALAVEALLEGDRRGVLLRWGGFVAASWAVALLNPDFLGGMLFPFQMIGMRGLVWINEWRATDFSRPQPLELVILVALGLGLSGRVRLPPVRLVLFLGLVHAALTHARNGQLLGLVGALILAEPLGASLGRPVAGRGPRLLPLAAIPVAAAAAALRLAVPVDAHGSGQAFNDVIVQVPETLRARPVLNEYGLGGNLIFAGVRPFIDSRADLYGDAFLAQYRVLADGERDAADRVLTKFDIAWTVFPQNHPMVPVIESRPGWHRLLRQDGVVIDIRDGG